MKVIKLIIPIICLFAINAAGQNSFYLNAHGGPRLSYSQNFNISNNLSTSKQWSSSYGIRIGHSFSNQHLAIETGLSRIRIDNAFDLNEGNSFDKGISNIYSYGHAWNIPVTIKASVFEFGKNVKVKGLLGVALSVRNRNLAMSKTAENAIINGNQLFFSTSGNLNQEKTDYQAFHRFNRSNSNWLIESGLEIEYNLYQNLNLTLSSKFQHGLKAEEGTVVYRVSKDLRYPMTEATTATTNGNGLMLNLGLTYSFSKRKKKTV